MSEPKCEFKRGASKDLAIGLKRLIGDQSSWLHHWLSETGSRRPFLAIRDGYANLYVDGCAFTLKSGAVNLEFHANYLSKNDKLKKKLNGYLCQSGDSQFYRLPGSTFDFSLLTEIIDTALEYQKEGKKSKDAERPAVTRALIQYPLSLDCEVCFSKEFVTNVAGELRINAPLKANKQKDWGTQKPDAVLLEPKNGRLILRFFEAKVAKNKKELMGNNPSVIQQVRLYDGLLKYGKDQIVEQYKKVIDLYAELDHPRFTEFKKVKDLKLELDIFHDIVILDDLDQSLSTTDVARLDHLLKNNDARRNIPRVHTDSNAGHWIK